MLFGPGFMQRVIFAFVVLTILSLTLDGLWLGATDYGTLQTLTWFQKYEIFGWAIPFVALAGFIMALPHMLVWDYAWFGSLGAFGSTMRLILASVTLIGFTWGFFTTLWPIIAQVAVAIARGVSGLVGRFFGV